MEAVGGIGTEAESGEQQLKHQRRPPTASRGSAERITAHNYCLSLTVWPQLRFLGNQAGSLSTSQRGNPDSRVFPQQPREAQWAPVWAPGPDAEHRGDLSPNRPRLCRRPAFTQ